MKVDESRLYLREEKMPHIWCPGCGNGILMHDVIRAIQSLGIEKDKLCIVSGIGCSSRAAGYLDFNTVHTTHGRAIPFATGIKLSRPELEVIVIAGDGDLAAIGGNHLIHACRRNIGLTVVVFNNEIYGMTGGQYSPTMPYGENATTTPYGNIERSLDIVQLAKAAGAGYVARGDCYHTEQTVSLIKRGITHNGFSLIDCVSVCPTYYGRKNHKGNAIEMLKWQRDNLRPAESPEQFGSYSIGVAFENSYPEYTQMYNELLCRITETGDEI